MEIRLTVFSLDCRTEHVQQFDIDSIHDEQTTFDIIKAILEGELRKSDLFSVKSKKGFVRYR